MWGLNNNPLFKIKLQALSVCVRYHDFLSHAVTTNKHLFDKWVIVTDLDDSKTVDLCGEHGLTCVKTNVFYEKGLFAKYAAVNEGLKYVDPDAWVLFLDADIVLHPHCRYVLEELPLDKSCIYGMDRLNVQGLLAYLDFKRGPGILKENWLLHSGGLEPGARLVHHYGGVDDNGKFLGYLPIGYFQLCHRSSFTKYPDESLGCDHGDMVMARQWPREKRILIPELYCVHLESLRTHKAANWNGRVSDPFTLPTSTANLTNISNTFTTTSTATSEQIVPVKHSHAHSHSIKRCLLYWWYRLLKWLYPKPKPY